MEHKYDFDKIIDRKGTGAVKTDALRRRMEHPIFGYAIEPEDYRPAIIDWIRDHHGWSIEKEWISYIPGIVKGIGMAINALLNKGDKVIIQPPLYHPFRLVPQRNGHEVVFNPLKEMPDGYYEMDFENLETVCDESCSMQHHIRCTKQDIQPGRNRKFILNHP